MHFCKFFSETGLFKLEEAVGGSSALSESFVREVVLKNTMFRRL